MKSTVAVAVVAVLLSLCCSFAAAAYSSAWKVEKLNELLKKGSFVEYDSKSFEKYVEGPRNFSTLVLFTAVKGSQNCESCRLIQPEYEAAANSWAALGHPSRLYFAVVDYASGAEVFGKFKLNTAPLLYHFPPNEGENAKAESKKDPMRFDKYDIARNGESAEDILKYAETLVHTSIPLVKAPEYTKFLLAIGFLLVSAAIMKLLATSFAVYLRNPLVWALIALIFTLTMTSGNMWNIIRGAPYTGRDEVISSSFGSQYILETRIVATIYGAGALALVGLISHVPRIQSATFQRYLVFGYTGLFFFCVSLLFFVFRIKNRGYPFRILF